MKKGYTFNSLSTDNLTDSAEKEVAIRDFGGVDHSHSTLFVDTSRAVEMSNFIKEGGINQKRKGFREIFQFDPEYTIEGGAITSINYKAINGVWELTCSTFNDTLNDYDRVKYLIVQSANKLYHITKNRIIDDVEIVEEGITTDANEYNSQYTLKAIEIPCNIDYGNVLSDSIKSFGVVDNEVLYILNGKCYLMVGIFEGVLKAIKVEDSDYTYVPTTTTFIPPSEYNELLEDSDHLLSSTTYEDVNMMTRYRKNKLQGLTLEALEAHAINYQIKEEGLVENTNGEYINSNGSVVVLDPYKYMDSTTETFTDNPFVFTYTLDSLPFNMDYGSTTEEKITNAISKMKVYATGKVHTPTGDVEYNNQLISRVTSFYNEGNKLNGLAYMVSYSDITIDEGIAYGTCKITFNYNVIPTTSINAITVVYPRYVKLANRINKCKFGCMFGYSNTNRLFASGNEEYPNIDYHTIDACEVSELNTNISASDKYSLTYFSDLGYTKVGGVVNSINGYAILGDGKMAIFKSLQGQEPTIYFRTSSSLSEQIKDVNGNEYTKITEVYPIQVGTIGEGNINFSTIQNLNGDTLMVSDNGVFGIELDTNVASSQRWAKRRSRLIDPEIKKYDLSQAVCTTFDDKFFLCVGEGKTFIADAIYPIKLNDELSTEYQYEWWEWNNVYARLFFSLGTQLWFGTDTGMLCCFEDINYKDVTSLDIDKSGICYVEKDNEDYNDKFVIAPQYISHLENMSMNDDFYINEDLYALAFDTASSEYSFEGTSIIYDYSNIEANEKFITFLFNLPNYSIYLDRIPTNDTMLELNQRYKFSLVLNDEDNKKVYLDLYKSTDRAVSREVSPTMVEEVLTPLDLDSATKGFRVCMKLDYGVQTICNVGTYIDDVYYLFSDFHEDSGKYYFTDSEGLVIKETEVKPIFNMFSIRDYSVGGNAVNILNYNEVVPTITNAKFVFNRNVECYYITPPFDMGTRYYNKDLRKLIIVPDTLLGASIDFGFKVSNYEKDFNAYTGKSFNFSDLDFDTLNFLSESFAKVYVKQARKKRWSYIQFYFKSSTDNNCKINNLTIIYTLGTKNKGVK